MSINAMTSSPRSYKLRILTDGTAGFRLPPSILKGGGDVRQIFEVCFGELEKNELHGGTLVCWGDQRRFLVYRGVSSSIQN